MRRTPPERKSRPAGTEAAFENKLKQEQRNWSYNKTKPARKRPSAEILSRVAEIFGAPPKRGAR